MRLYKLGARGTGLRALDPHTLRDLPSQPLLSIWPRQKVTIGDAPAVLTAPDGARFAVLATRQNSARRARDMTLQLFDASTGKPLSTAHHPPIPFWMMGISADGSRLFGTRRDINWNEPCTATSFYVLDARTGHMLHRLSAQVSWGWEPFLVDQNLDKLYVLNVPDQRDDCGPWKGPRPTLAVYSLSSGKLLAGLRLDQVLAGVWSTNRVISNQIVLAVQNPGFALSPDGSQLAVLDGSSDRLTLLDSRSLRIEATERLAPASGLLEKMASALGLLPGAAEAKGEEDGRTLLLQYTADGRSLLVTGSWTRPNPNRLFSKAGPLPLRLVNIATGHVEAHLPTKKQIYALWPAPDGGLYSLVPGTDQPQLCPCTVRRHDPATLRILASRTFLDDSGLYLYFLQAPRP